MFNKTTYVKPPSDEILLTTSPETRGVNIAILVMASIFIVSKRLKSVGVQLTA